MRFLNNWEDQITDFSYDAAGNRVSMAEYNNTSHVATNLKRKTTYTYDAARRLTRVGFDTDGDGTVDEAVSYAYDEVGNRTYMTLPGSKTIAYHYDVKGQLIKLTDWADQITDFSYDGAGQHVYTWRPNRVWSDYIYYSDRFLRRIKHQLNWNARMYLMYRVRPNGDRKIALEDFSTQTTRRQTQTRTGQGVTFPKGPWTDEGGYKQTAKWGSVMEIAYTGDGALLTIGTGPDHGMIDISINGWFWRSFNGYEERVGEKVIELPKVVKPDDEATGKVSIEVRSDNHHRSTDRVFRFKQIEVITIVSEDRHHVDAISYGYDGLNRLTQADGTTDHTYAYDRSGNLTSKDGTARTYNTANQLTAIGNRNLTYDANGNLTSDGTNTYTWDRANRLTQVGNTTYSYDGLGNRVSQTVNTTRTDYLLDLQSSLPKVLAATTGTNTERYIHAIRGLHATEDSNGDWTYALEDALGSVRGTIGSGRQFTTTHNYDPYGNPAGNYGAGFGYAGEQIDSNGLSYNRARYYNPSLAIFPSLDPYPGTMGRPMSLNGYAYVEGNTPNRTDPSGMISRTRSLTPGLGGSVIRPPAVKTSRMRNSLVCRTPAASFAQTGSVGVGMPAAPAVRVAHRSSPAASGAICCVGAPPIVFCYDCSAFPPIIPTFEPDDYEDALTEMLNVIDTVSASAFHVVINATNLQILFYNLNPFLPDLPKIPDIDTIVDWAKGELGLSSSVKTVEGFLTPELTWVEELTHYSQQELNQMRVQIQRNKGEDYSVVAIALPDVGVSALQIRTGMEAMYNSLSIGASWIPKNKYGDVRSAIVRMSQRLDGFVAGGGIVQGGQVVQELIEGRNFRLDLENNRGHNLRI